MSRRLNTLRLVTCNLGLKYKKVLFWKYQIKLTSAQTLLFDAIEVNPWQARNVFSLT